MHNKNTKHSIPSSLSLIALSLLSTLATPVTFAEDVLDTIVITGEKIDKSAKDTTTAVTVITEDEIASSDKRTAHEIATEAPNVIGDSSFSNISIRGVSGGGAATGGAALITGSRPRVATVVDGSTQDWSGYNFTPVSLWDAEQVEVLRGPQSTAQGATAIAGAVVVNTNDPTFEDEAAVRIGLEHHDNGNMQYNLAAMSSGALIDDELAYRFAIDGAKDEGWINYDEPSGNDYPDLAESKNLNVRGKLLWEPASIPELSTKLTLNYHKNEGEHTGFVSNTDEGIATQTLDVSAAVARVQDSDENDVGLDVNYELSPGITNALHISHIDSDIYADGYQNSTVNTYAIDQKSTAVENRVLFNQDNAKLTGVLGLYVSTKDSVIDATQNGISIDTAYTTDTTAAYGESTYALTPKTNVTAGLRVENEDVDKSGSIVATAYNVDTGNVDQDYDKTHTLPKLAVTQDISDTTTLGASVRKGYSPGGTSIDTLGNISEFDSEEVTTFELSSKSDFGNGTVITANLFYNNYTDYQAPSSSFAILNVDEAHTYGLEIEATTWLTENVELRGSVGLLKSEVDKYDDDTSTEGNDLSSAPGTNLGLGFTYYIGDAWSVGADVTYVGEYYSDLDNSDKAGDYALTDIRAQYTLGDLTIDGYITNLTNEEAVFYRSGALATVAETRTIGISATYRM